MTTKFRWIPEPEQDERVRIIPESGMIVESNGIRYLIVGTTLKAGVYYMLVNITGNGYTGSGMNTDSLIELLNDGDFTHVEGELKPVTKTQKVVTS